MLSYCSICRYENARITNTMQEPENMYVYGKECALEKGSPLV